MRFLWVFLITITLITSVYSQKPVNQWKISDYLDNLPAKYKLLGNFAGPTENTTIIDNKNGYAAYLHGEDDPSYAALEMALFKPNKGIPTLVVTNVEDDHVCGNNYSHFLQLRGKRWIDVKSKVLPKLDFSMIFVDGKNDDSYKFYQKLQKKYGDKISNLEF